VILVLTKLSMLSTPILRSLKRRGAGVVSPSRARRLLKLCCHFVAITFAWAAIYAHGAEPMQVTAFTPLFDAIAGRLQIARQVVLAKWDSHQAIEDPAREEVVIAAATNQAVAQGLPRDFAIRFFTDQIEANKVVQYGLLSNWRRAGKAPDDPRLNLADDIRPRLDRLQAEFIRQLVATQSLRKEKDCPVRIAKASSLYADEHHLDALYAVAFDRALARVCQE
jgi:chorismate mutase